MRYAAPPTIARWVPMHAAKGRQIREVIFAASGMAIALLFTDRTYAAFRITEDDVLDGLLPRDLLMHFRPQQLVRGGICDEVTLCAWRNAQQQRMEEQRRAARYFMYAQLRKEFEPHAGDVIAVVD